MKYSTQIKPISYLSAHAAEVVRELAEQRKPLVITQNGKARAVIQNVAINRCISIRRITPSPSGRGLGRGDKIHANTYATINIF